MSLIARHLEALGTPTLCLATAYDIIAAGNPPRAVFADFPLGHPFGHGDAPDQQYAVARAALAGFETIDKPGSILTLDDVWSEDESWRQTVTDTSSGDRRPARDLTPRYQFEEDRIAAEGA